MDDTITLLPEIGVPYVPQTKYADLRERAEAACNTALDLEKLGLDLTPTDADMETAAALAHAYAEDPEGTSKKVTPRRVADLRPASIVLASNILQEFSHTVVENSLHIRNLVTNKLLLETEHNDARVRLKALELLGKISDVGLFTEKREVSVTHQTTDDLRAKLKTKLHKLIRSDEEDDIEYAVYELIDDDSA